MRAIVLDDEPGCLRVQRAILSRMGFAVDAFDDPADAIAGNVDPADVAIVDVVLRGGVNGFDIGAELESRHPGLHVLYCSGSPPDLLEAAGRLPRGLDITGRFIQKPFTATAFSDSVRELLRNSGAFRRS